MLYSLYSLSLQKATDRVPSFFIEVDVEVPRVDYEKLANKRQVEDSKTICARVQAAGERQLERFKETKLTCNAEMVQPKCGISARIPCYHLFRRAESLQFDVRDGS